MARLVSVSDSPEATELLGQLLGKLLKPGMFIALHGELGGGKTCFTRGVIAGAAPQSSHMVASPTFAIMNEYPGAPSIYHFDFYRLASSSEIAELGFEDFFEGKGICIVEWPERMAELLPDDHLSVTFEHSGDTRRTITLESLGKRHDSLLAELAAPLNVKNV